MYMAIGTVLVGTLLIYLIVGLKFLLAVSTFLPPAYKSFKAIESDDKDDDTQWLTYWVVWSFLNISEYGDFLAYIIPYYFVLKTAFLTYAWHFMGAKKLYEVVVRPILSKVPGDKIDAVLDKAGEIAKSVGKEVADKVNKSQ